MQSIEQMQLVNLLCFLKAYAEAANDGKRIRSAMTVG